jgi:putative transposase
MPYPFLLCILKEIERIQSTRIGYGLYLLLYFLGLSYRNTSKALAQFVKRSHLAVWKWIQRYKPKKIARKRKRISGLMIDDTIVKIGSNYMWIWVDIKLKSREILALNVSKERNLLIAKRDLFHVWSKFMEGIQYQQMVESGIHKPAGP